MTINVCKKVRPGDLITDEQYNCLIDWLANMEDRHIDLEEGLSNLKERISELEEQIANEKRVIITDINPKGVLPLGVEVSLVGRNFATPSVMNNVTLGGIPIQVFNPGSGEELLKFNVPLDISGVPKQAELKVSAGGSSDSILVDLVEAAKEKPTGLVVISEARENANLGKIAVNETYTWGFQIDSQTNVAEVYQIGVRFTNSVGVGNNAWLQDHTQVWFLNRQLDEVTTLVSAQGQPLNKVTTTQKIDPSRPFNIGIQVKVPENAESVKMVLWVISINNPTELTSLYTVDIVVGQKSEVSDPRVSFALLNFGGASKGRINENGYVEIPFGGSALVRVQANFHVQGEYTYSLSLEDTPADTWTVGELGNETGTSHKEVGEVEILSTRLSLKLENDPGNHQEQGTLVIRAKHDGEESLVSFTRLKIQGYVATN